MSEPVVPPPPSDSSASPKKGLSTGAKVAIGCLVALLVCMGGCAIVTFWIGKKATNFVKDMENNPNAATVKAVEMMMKFNPDVEVVSSDPGKGTITLRDKKTGKVVTFNAVDIQNGKFSFEEDGKSTSVDFSGGEQGGTMAVESDEGRAVFGAGDAASVPAWVPSYPGARQEGFNSLEANGGREGTFTLHTGDPVDQVASWFESTLKAAGFEVEKSTLDVQGALTANVNAKSGNRGVNVVVSSQEGETQGLVAYSEKP